MGTYVTLTTQGNHSLARTLNCRTVALVNVCLPLKYYNIKKNNIQVKNADGWTAYTFPGGYYESLFSVATTLQHIVEDYFTISIDNEQELLIIEAKSERTRLKISGYFAAILKWPVFIRGNARSSSPVQLKTFAFFVKCNVVKSQLINHTSLGFLGVVSPSNTTIYNPVYHPVAYNEISSVNVHLLDNKGEMVAFVDGEPTFVLHFV